MVAKEGVTFRLLALAVLLTQENLYQILYLKNKIYRNFKKLLTLCLMFSIISTKVDFPT